MATTRVIIKALITEKSMSQAGGGRYTFVVLKNADKPTIKRAIEDEFSVNVTSVETVVTKGDRKRVGKRRVEMNTNAWKKAIVQVKSGQKIGLFELGG